MCNWLWSNHTYPINLLFSYNSLFFIIFTIFIIIIILILLQRWYIFIYDTAFLWWNVFSFIYFINIFMLCCFISFGSTGHLVCDTAFGMQHTKCLGGMCYLVIFGWYLGHLESPITPVTHWVLMWIIHIFILSNLKLYFFNLFIHIYCFLCRISCISLWYFCCINTDFYCTDVGTLI